MSVAAHIRIFQSEDESSSPQMILPYSYLMLRKANASSGSLILALEQFLADGERLALKELRGLEAEEVVDLLDELIRVRLDGCPRLRRPTIRFLQSLCRSCGVFPASYTLQGEVSATSGMPRTSGGFGEVWLGTWGCEKVAIKVIKATAAADPKELMKQLAKEVIVWGQLNHRNLLPLYGISTSFKVANDGYPNPCLVSPWMENGKLCVFVRKNPTFNRFNLLVDVCNGLIYLHSEYIVHGDLKGDNVLIDNENRACLADFGFTAVCNSLGFPRPSSSGNVGGTVVYMAPELFQVEDQSSNPLAKPPADIYALGMLIYEVLSGEYPFRGRDPRGLAYTIVRGDRPKRPSWSPIPDPVWDMVELCWREEPAERPKLDEILSSLASASLDPPAEWPLPPSAVSSPITTKIHPAPPIVTSRQSEIIKSRSPPSRPIRGSHTFP